MVVDPDDCVHVVFMLEEIGEQRGNPPVRLGDHMIILQATPGIETGSQR